MVQTEWIKVRCVKFSADLDLEFVPSTGVLSAFHYLEFAGLIRRPPEDRFCGHAEAVDSEFAGCGMNWQVQW